MNRKDFLYVCGMALPLSMFGLSGKAMPGYHEKKKEKFSFAFLTDVHLELNNEKGSHEGLRKALQDVKRRNVDFILFGGDNTQTDHLKKEDEQTANAMHAKFKEMVDECGMECHFTIGNHDRFYFHNGEKDELGYKLFEKYFGPSRISFNHKGVHFVSLNSLNPDKEGNFSIGAEEMDWLKRDLDAIGKDMPVVVAQHVPMLSLYYPVVEGNFLGKDMITDTKPLFELLKGYNVQLVLQGHQHIHEELLERNHWFVTGGAVCASWWNGPLTDTEEGYVIVHVDADNRFSWEYIDYQWEARSSE